jgi:hypothetical protein
VSYIDRSIRTFLAGLSLLAGCSSSPPAPSSAAVPAPVTPIAPSPSVTSARLPPATPVSNWSDFRVQAARRIVAANPSGTYMGVPPDMLLAIPVLEVELNSDGSVRKIVYIREPRQAKETLQMAADAVRRAAPFADVSRLPKPWRFTETFLFDEDMKFKPRSLD